MQWNNNGISYSCEVGDLIRLAVIGRYGVEGYHGAVAVDDVIIHQLYGDTAESTQAALETWMRSWVESVLVSL